MVIAMLTNPLVVNTLRLLGNEVTFMEQGTP